MKKDNIQGYRFFKTTQLVLLIVFLLAFFIYLKTDPVLSNNIFTNTKLLTICVFLWAFMIFSFFAILIDLKQLEKSILDSDSLNQMAFIDNLTGIPNRASCDLIFQKYENAQDISNLACSLISILNLSIINEAIGREKGDALLLDFASTFEKIGSKYGFVGRNSGNEFLIVIDDCNEEKMNDFLNELSSTIKEHNDSTNHMPLTYKTATVYNSVLRKQDFKELITQLYKERG